MSALIISCVHLKAQGRRVELNAEGHLSYIGITQYVLETLLMKSVLKEYPAVEVEFESKSLLELFIVA
jgi:hypothetical protein